MEAKTFLSADKLLLLFSFLVAGCSPSAPVGGGTGGPIDGGYVATTWTCGSTDVYAYLTSGSVTAIAFAVSNTAGSSIVTYSGGCIRTQTFAASYPASATFSIINNAPTCSSACSVQCNGYIAATETYSYTSSSSSIMTTRTLSSQDISANSALSAAGCSAGQVETRTLSKNVDGNSPTSYTFLLSGPTQVTHNQCSAPISETAYTSTGGHTTVTQATAVSPAVASGSGALYSDSLCSQPLTNGGTIPVGGNTFQFYFKSATAGTTVLTTGVAGATTGNFGKLQLTVN